MENFKPNTIKSVETSANNLESKEEKIFSSYKPEFDMALGIPFDLPKEEWDKLQPALDSSYEVENSADIELLENQLNDIKSSLDGKFSSDASYNLLSTEIDKLQKNADKLYRLQNSLGKFGQQNEALEKKWHDVSNQKSDYSRLLYKTTRGFLEQRAEHMENHISKTKDEQSNGGSIQGLNKNIINNIGEKI